ncbi:hypothetical protein MZM54_02340 [[Brevibacterium] frigoritolerans]|nr:hypothetical protein [Peribacillus frigoritolerans]
MKRKISGFIFLGMLILAGCESEKHDFNADIVKAEPKKTNYVTTYDLDVKSTENKIAVTLSMENGKENPLPILTPEGHLFSILLTKQDGAILDKKYVEVEDRKQIQRQEKISYDVDLEANVDGEVIVQTELLLKSDKYQTYDIQNKVQSESVLVETDQISSPDVAFAPNKEVTYTYATGKKKKIKEKFQHFNGNKVQSFSSEKGVQFYSKESDGVYYFSSPDPIGDIDGTEYIEKENMRLLIPLPLVEDKTWKVDKKTYILSEDDIKVKTRLGLFDHCIEVTEIDEKTKTTRYYYYREDIGLLKVKRAKNKMLPSKTEMELTKIEFTKSHKDKNENKKTPGE